MFRTVGAGGKYNRSGTSIGQFAFYVLMFSLLSHSDHYFANLKENRYLTLTDASTIFPKKCNIPLGFC